MKIAAGALGAGVLIALISTQTVLGSGAAAAQPFNPYVSAVDTLVSRFESALGRKADPQWSERENQKLAEAFGQLLAEYDIDNETTAIAFETLDGSLSYYMNPDEEYLAASLYKLPLAVYFYDRIADGRMDPDDRLPYTADMYEPGSVIAADYQIGSRVPLDELLEALIVYSDNTAGHILFESLGGWPQFRQAIRTYAPDASQSEEFVSMDNVISCRYMNEILRRIAEHPENYETLIQDMQKAQPEHYLNTLLEQPIPQKYGAYGAQVNASGFSLSSPHPYVLTVMTDDIAAEPFLADVALLIEQTTDKGSHADDTQGSVLVTPADTE